MAYTNVGVAQTRFHANPLSGQAIPSCLDPVVSPRRSNPLEHFATIFDASIAHTREQRLACLRIRFQVYCVDNPFEDPAQHPDGMESDSHDEYCAHSLMTHRSTGKPIGTARLLLPHAAGKRRMLPMQTLAGPIACGALAPFPVARTGEVSRFAILKSIHQQVGDGMLRPDVPPDQWRKMLMHLPIGLIRSCLEMSVRAGLTHIAAVLEPALLRLLARFSIAMNPLGGLIDHHGKRQPCWASWDVLLRHVYDEQPEVWQVLTDHGRLWPRPARRPEAFPIQQPGTRATLIRVRP